MKILYITLENLSLQKGSVVHVKEMVHGLQKLGHQVGLISRASGQDKPVGFFYNIYPKSFFSQKWIKTKPLSYAISSLFLFISLFKVLSRYDVIYARDYHTAILALFPRLIFKKKIILEINGLAHEEQKLKGHSIFNRWIAFFIQEAERIAVRCSDRIISVTPEIASYLTHHFGCKEDKVEVVGNGVNTGNFYPIQEETLLNDLKGRLGIGLNDRVVVFIGNLAPWQGIEYLIQIAPMLLKKLKDIRFLIIGDGILRKGLIAEVNRLRLSDHFIFTGMVNYQQIPVYINIADVCLVMKRKLKSGYSPIKLYEYMACGKPIIASRVEGLELIESEGIGLLAEPEDPISLQRVIEDLLADPQKRSEMGQKGLRIAREKFDWSSKVGHIEKTLKELV